MAAELAWTFVDDGSAEVTADDGAYLVFEVERGRDGRLVGRFQGHTPDGRHFTSLEKTDWSTIEKYIPRNEWPLIVDGSTSLSAKPENQVLQVAIASFARQAEDAQPVLEPDTIQSDLPGLRARWVNCEHDRLTLEGYRGGRYPIIARLGNTDVSLDDGVTIDFALCYDREKDPMDSPWFVMRHATNHSDEHFMTEPAWIEAKKEDLHPDVWKSWFSPELHRRMEDIDIQLQAESFEQAITEYANYELRESVCEFVQSSPGMSASIDSDAVAESMVRAFLDDMRRRYNIFSGSVEPEVEHNWPLERSKALIEASKPIRKNAPTVAQQGGVQSVTSRKLVQGSDHVRRNSL